MAELDLDAPVGEAAGDGVEGVPRQLDREVEGVERAVERLAPPHGCRRVGLEVLSVGRAKWPSAELRRGDRGGGPAQARLSAPSIRSTRSLAAGSLHLGEQVEDRGDHLGVGVHHEAAEGAGQVALGGGVPDQGGGRLVAAYVAEADRAG